MTSSRRRNATAFTRLLALAVAVALPASLSIATETASAQSVAAELLPAAILPAADAATDRATLRLAAEAPAATASDDEISGDVAAHAASLDESLVCMAKVVHHEARNQPRAGQLAVAQLIMARLAAGRFGDTVCGVVNQHGQFFDTASYSPDRAAAAWATAIEVSREAMQHVAAEVAPGALFFHAAYAQPSSFFRSRQRVAMLGDHIFYR